MSLGYISQRDGAQNTLMLSEGLLLPQGATEERTWTASPATPPLPPGEGVVGFMWGMAADSDILGQLRMTYADPTNPQIADAEPGPGNPSSRHGGGVVVAFCGGNVRFLNDDIPYRVYQHLMTPDSKEANQVAIALGEDASNVAGVLNEGDF